MYTSLIFFTHSSGVGMRPTPDTSCKGADKNCRFYSNASFCEIISMGAYQLQVHRKNECFIPFFKKRADAQINKKPAQV